MPTEVIMPKVDMDMEVGRIAAWHVAEGERVEKDAALFDIETDKASMEVEAPASGTLHHVAVAEGEESPIGTAVAWIYADGEEVGEAPAGKQAAAPEKDAKVAAGEPEPKEERAHERAAATERTAGTGRAAATERAAGNGAHKPRATPVARRLAKDAGIALEELEGSGPRGRITRSDVEAATAEADQAPSSKARRRTASASQAPPTRRAGPEPASAGGLDTGHVVLIHGFAGDRTGFAPLEKALAPNRPTTLELPGHGRAPVAQVATLYDLANPVRDALEDASDTPVHLVAHSLGGAVAIVLADQVPERVASLTLIAPAGLGPEIDGAALDGIVRATKPESLAPWLQRLVANPELVSWNYVQTVMAQRSDETKRAAQQDMARALFPDGTQGFDVAPMLQRLECPVRIIWGRGDRIIPWRHALRAPGRVSLNLFPATGHLPHLERTEAVAALIAETARMAG